MTGPIALGCGAPSSGPHVPSRARTLAGPAAGSSAERGAALALLCHVLLLAVILGMVVYLASRHRVRVDLTTDKLYSVTQSTRDLLGKLDKRLVIEAYFSPKDKLPVSIRDTRDVLDNFLDEMVQLGKGKVVVQRFDPNSDNAIAQRCSRIGVQPADIRGTSSTSVSVDRHWQGLRFVYGGDRQKVLPQLGPSSSFLAEAMLTPAVKEVITSQKRKFGYMEWQAQAVGAQQPSGVGWNLLRTNESIAKRYEFQNFKDDDGALLPADLDTLFLFRPKDLTDRQKYVLDQFVVRGGTLVVFADAAEYAIGPQRVFNNIRVTLDAAGSTKKLQDQLLSYGVDWRPKVVADLMQDANRPRDPVTGAAEYLAIVQQTGFGPQTRPIPYPYFFHAVAHDWRDTADMFAKGKDGKVDESLAAQYRTQFVAGMPTDDFLFQPFQQIRRSPGFYWPTWVGLRSNAGGAPDLPEGVKGRVLLWSSPAALVEDPPQTLNPLQGNDDRARNESYTKFQKALNERFVSEPRQQAPLMVDVRGTFASYFANGERPKRPSEIKEEEAKKLADDAKKAENQATGKDAQDPQQVGPDKPKEDAVAAAVPTEPAMLAKGDKPGRIVMVGDSDFIRDDLVRGDYRQAGGPWSTMGPTFFAGMLDWLAEDRDLIALQSRVPTDRTLQFVEPNADPIAAARTGEQTLRTKTNWLVALNVLIPSGLLILFGLFVWLLRRAQKRSFLASVGN